MFRRHQKMSDIGNDLAALLDKVQPLVESMVRDHGFQLFIDTQEKLEQIKDGLSGLGVMRSLPAGDIWIVYNGKLLFVIERKSVADLSGSISNHHRMQLFKLKCLPLPTYRIYYLVEGTEAGGRGFLKSRSSLQGCQADIVVRDHMNLFHTEDPLGTVYWILKLVLKVHEHGHTWADELSRQPDCGPLLEQHTQRKREEQEEEEEGKGGPTAAPPVEAEEAARARQRRYLVEFVEASCRNANERKAVVASQRACFMRQLAAINGISAAKALSIADALPSWTRLCELLNRSEDEFVETVGNLRFVADGATKKGKAQKKKKPGTEDQVSKGKTKRAPKQQQEGKRIGDALATKLAFLVKEASDSLE